MWLGNDLAGDRMRSKPISPILQTHPTTSPDLKQLEDGLPQASPLCDVTRAMAKRGVDEVNVCACPPDLNNDTFALPNDLNLTQLFAEPGIVSADVPLPAGVAPGGKEALIQAQEEDETSTALWDQAEAESQDTGPTTTYLSRDCISLRRWLPPRHPQDDADWAAVDQVVLPTTYRRPIVELPHDGRCASRLGVRTVFFTNFGYPYRVQTDGASRFKGKVFEELVRTVGMQHFLCPVHIIRRVKGRSNAPIRL